MSDNTPIVATHGETIARRRLGLMDKWEMCGFQKLDGLESWTFSMAVPTFIERGARKGQKKWTGPTLRCCITSEEIQAEFHRYEAETGQCGLCCGSGQEWAGWNHKTGNRWRTCSRCNGSGERAVAA